MTSEQVKELTGYLYRAINASVFGVPAEAVPQLHERLDKLVEHIEAQDAEIERLRMRDGNAAISLLLPTEANPFERDDVYVLDFGVADNCYLVESPEVKKLLDDLAAACTNRTALTDKIDRLYADLIAETKSHAETAGFLQDRKDQLATIRAALSAVLGDGEPVELAKLAAKVIPELAWRLNDITGTCPPDADGKEMWDDCDTKCKDGSPSECWIRAALDAAKGGE